MRTKLLVAAGLALLALPATTNAATLRVEGGTYVYEGTDGPDGLNVRGDDDGLLVFSGMGSNPPAGCVSGVWDNDAHCQPGPVRVEGKGGNDRMAIELTTPPGLVPHLLGGDGDDVIVGTDGASILDAGNGNDEITGGAGADTVLGGPGDDLVTGDGYVSASPDVIDGGPGYDTSTSDWTNHSSGPPTPPVSVTLEGVANDGRPGEGDNVTGLERIRFSNAVTLVAAGDPVDFEVPSNAGTVQVKLVGSPGPDKLKAAHGHDELDGGAGDDTIEGGFGNDVITGGPGRDQINADASGGCDFVVCHAPLGNDKIYARDGEADTIECGPGTDTAYVDAIDTTSGCETVERGSGPAPGGPGTPNPPGGGAPGTTTCVVPKIPAGLKLSTARTRLRKAGCATKTVKIRSRKVAKGRVVRISRKRGSKVSAGRKVTIYVSKGRR